MRDAAPDRRGLLSALLNLTRYLGLISGAAVMGAVFAFAAGPDDVAVSAPSAVATGLRVAFGSGGDGGPGVRRRRRLASRPV